MKTATILLSAAALAVLTTGPARTQSAPAAPACSADRHDDFDFWLGEWNVYAPDDGPYQGHNSIRKVNGDCLITEHWVGASGTVGDSMNFHDPLIGAWRQVWVSPGWYIDYHGGLNADGAMVLTGQSHTLATGQTAEFRGTWTLNDDGSVSQFFEQQDAEGVWQAAFLGIYVREENDPRAAEAAAARGE
jgi:hypothetical protein